MLIQYYYCSVSILIAQSDFLLLNFIIAHLSIFIAHFSIFNAHLNISQIEFIKTIQNTNKKSPRYHKQLLGNVDESIS